MRQGLVVGREQLDAAALPGERLLDALKPDATHPFAAVRVVQELVKSLEEHRAHILEAGQLEERRARNLRSEVLAIATYRLRRELEQSIADDVRVQDLLDQVVARRLDPASAATEILRMRT